MSWRPIETAPKDAEVLVYDTFLGCRFARYDASAELFGDEASWFLHVTHWMPEPEPPK